MPSNYNNYISYIQNKNIIYICLRKDKYTFENNINELYFILCIVSTFNYKKI